jgi:heme O synthase-like polyprenyltransferase
MGPVYGLCAAAGGGFFLRQSWRLMRAPERKAAMATFKASLLHFTLLAAGVILDRALDWGMAWAG